MDVQEQFAKEFDLTKPELKFLMKSCNSEQLYTCLELLKAGRHKSTFRSSCALKIREWLKIQLSDDERNVMPTIRPLTNREFDLCKPSWPVKYSIPA